jgi:hypothetical protein
MCIEICVYFFYFLKDRDFEGVLIGSLNSYIPQDGSFNKCIYIYVYIYVYVYIYIYIYMYVYLHSLKYINIYDWGLLLQLKPTSIRILWHLL